MAASPSMTVSPLKGCVTEAASGGCYQPGHGVSRSFPGSPLLLGDPCSHCKYSVIFTDDIFALMFNYLPADYDNTRFLTVF